MRTSTKNVGEKSQNTANCALEWHNSRPFLSIWCVVYKKQVTGSLRPLYYIVRGGKKGDET